METLPTIKNSKISRRDFLKLKSLLMIWLTFFQSFGINLFANTSIQKIDYSLLDKLLELPFSDTVMAELELRVKLQKKYNKDANGNLHSLNRFIKEMINFIISEKDFQDFKLLNSIEDEQIDYTYMLNSTAKHNELNSMKYLQKKLIAHKDNKMLETALEYAIKSQSFESTIYLMQQKIKLNDKSQKQLLEVLHQEEYENFYKKISGNKTMLLPNYSKSNILTKRKMCKKTFSFLEYSFYDDTMVYEYLIIKVHNSLVDLYLQNFIDEFTINFDKAIVYINTYATSYSLDFINKFETSLYNNGFNKWHDELLGLCEKEDMMAYSEISHLINQINKSFYNNNLDIYDFINLEML